MEFSCSWIFTILSFLSTTISFRIFQQMPLSFTSGKVHFHLSGCPNNQIVRYWEADNHKELRERPSTRRTSYRMVHFKIKIVGICIFHKWEKSICFNKFRSAGIDVTDFSGTKILLIIRIYIDSTGWNHRAYSVKDQWRFRREQFPGYLISLRVDAW